MSVVKNRHLLGLAVLLPAAAMSASAEDDAIAECARISSTGDRILCLEDALRRLSPPDTPAVIPDVDDEVLPAEVSDALTGADEAVTESVALGAAAAISTAEEEADESEIRVEAAGASAASDTTSPIELGAEQIARQNGEKEELVRISASIVDHTMVGTGRLRLTLDNGQVWQQTGDDDDRIARRIRGQANISIEMWQSRSGGYRMHLLEIDRTLRVRRIR